MSSAWTSRVVLPCLGIASVLVLWALVSQLVAPDLPGPLKTWVESRRYVVEPFLKARRPIPWFISPSLKKGSTT